eukprot:CAMPEP_0167745576 /NCGR_PEP_ID=MMETSP0110_2-20121227/3226_1 /TAXON_ID=629695 /ORGANISM="Gymnochlora sp., Strain CCMP2014" /LENGTH=176 /DNA_ID=CAMNT_0007630229 /DNA_START=1147 /DNA_END=1674 /DNA_ORIENTATION=-
MNDLLSKVSSNDLERRRSMPLPISPEKDEIKTSVSSPDVSFKETIANWKGSVRDRVARIERSNSDVVNEVRSAISPKSGRLGSIFLVRHGERLDHINPAWRTRAANPFDSPLSDNGVQQAKETGIRLQSERIHQILASPFLRTLQTAVEIAKQVGAKVCVENGIAEHILHENFVKW